MKQTVKRIVAGILFFSIFFSIIMYAGFIGRPYYNGAYNYDIWQYFYEEDDNTHNVINIASSAMYRYWVPPQAYEEQGITSFTIGSTRQPFGTVPYIMEEALKTQNPDLIVVEVRSLLNQRIYEIEDSANGQPDMQSWVLGVIASGMKYSSTRFNMIRETYVDTEGDCELYWHIPILKWHSLEYSLPLEERLSRISPTKDPYKSTYLNSGVKILKKASAEKKLVGEYYLTDEQKALLDKVVKTAEDFGVELLLVSTPYLLDKASASMQKSIEDYVTEKNYPYVDFNDYVDEIGLDRETDFYNSLHTNVVGAKKFTSFFAKYLVDNYEFDNVTLTDKQTKEWQETCESWAKKYKSMEKSWKSNVSKAQKAAAQKQETDTATDLEE